MLHRRECQSAAGVDSRMTMHHRLSSWNRRCDGNVSEPVCPENASMTTVYAAEMWGVVRIQPDRQNMPFLLHGLWAASD